MGRCSEDVYYNGNPWYLNTLAVAEQLYDSLLVWKHEEKIVISAISLPFFRDFLPYISPGTYDINSDIYKTLIEAITAYADGFIGIVAKYTASNGSLAEQFSKDDGTPLSAHDLTWSYASFLTASARRAGIVPPSWAGTLNSSVPDSCQGTWIIGSYSSATATSFPPSQTPITKPLLPPTTTEKTSVSPTTTSCAIATSVIVTFHGSIRTKYGETIKIVGNVEELGNWDPDKADSLSPSEYTSQSPLWKIAIPFEAGRVIEYKYINVHEDGSMIWEKDPNHTFTIPKSCATTVIKADQWHR